jgi:putative tricarboxylic transport membrane protein
VRALAGPLIFLGVSGLYLATSLTFPLGNAARPGAGFFPVAVALYLCGLGAILAVAAWRRAPAAPPTAVRTALVAGDARARVAVLMVALIGFCLALGWVGYPAASFLFVAVGLKSLGQGSWPAALLIALAAAAVSYYLFGVLLGVPLPRGALLG